MSAFRLFERSSFLRRFGNGSRNDKESHLRSYAFLILSLRETVGAFLQQFLEIARKKNKTSIFLLVSIW